MIKKLRVTIKITDDETWDDNIPLEFEIKQARALYIELGKIFDKQIENGDLKTEEEFKVY